MFNFFFFKQNIIFSPTFTRLQKYNHINRMMHLELMPRWHSVSRSLFLFLEYYFYIFLTWWSMQMYTKHCPFILKKNVIWFYKHIILYPKMLTVPLEVAASCESVLLEGSCDSDRRPFLWQSCFSSSLSL